MEANELLFAGLCSARCLLAMETPQGWVGCTCVCDGRYHAALIFAPVEQQEPMLDSYGNVLGDRPLLELNDA